MDGVPEIFTRVIFLLNHIVRQPAEVGTHVTCVLLLQSCWSFQRFQSTSDADMVLRRTWRLSFFHVVAWLHGNAGEANAMCKVLQTARSNDCAVGRCGVLRDQKSKDPFDHYLNLVASCCSTHEKSLTDRTSISLSLPNRCSPSTMRLKV